VETEGSRGVLPFEAVLVIVVTFFLSIFVGAIILFTLGYEATLIFGELIILIVPFSYLIYKHVNIKDYVRIDPKPKFVLIGLACGVLLLPLNNIIVTALTAILGNSNVVEEANMRFTSLSATIPGLIAVTTSMTLAGICEEFAFRGFLQNSIFKNLQKNPKFSKYAFHVAVLVAAAAFGFFHFDPQLVYILATFLAGLVLGYIYHRWGYAASATAHASMNLIVLALLLLGF
jgi:membrane protease YdiL (CAAX protease family)